MNLCRIEQFCKTVKTLIVLIQLALVITSQLQEILQEEGQEREQRLQEQEQQLQEQEPLNKAGRKQANVLNVLKLWMDFNVALGKIILLVQYVGN